VQNEYTAVIQRRDDCWIGWIAELPDVNCQASTKEALLESVHDWHTALPLS